MKIFNKRFAILLPIIAGTCWGITGIFTRYFVQEGLDNLTIVFTRTIVGMLLTFMYITLTRVKLREVAIRDLLILFISSIFGTSLFMVFYNIAVVELTLSFAAIILCMTPVFVLIISSIIYKEDITVKKVICMIGAIFGCVLLSGIFDIGTSIKWSGLGLMTAIGAMACSGIYILMTKNIGMKGYNPILMCFYPFMFASIMLSPFVDWNGLGTFIVSNPVESVGMMLLQSVVTSLTPSVAYIVGMKYVDAGMTAILEGGAEPGAAMIAGMILFAEMPTYLGVAGMIMTVISLGILARENIKTKTP